MLRKIEAKVLIVDDLPENLLALRSLIQSEDRTVFQASSADEALSLLLENEFALAILDVKMPGMNGFELAELMRGTEKTKHIPIIFVSAVGRDMDYAFRGYESGAVDFLHKPLSPFEVRSKVSMFVELYRHRKALSMQLEVVEAARREQEALLEELRETQAELQKAVEMRDVFMSIASHELRTPLNGLILDVQLRRLRLEQGRMDAFTPDKLQEMITRDERQIRSLSRLIDDMLDVSRIRTGKLSVRPEPGDLGVLAGNVVESLAAQFTNTGTPIDLHVEGPAPVMMDEFRIEQVLANLLTNALRYGGGNPVSVRVAAEGEQVRAEVRDQGLGISEEDQGRVFEQFERVSGTSVAQGLGLGLFISEQIVQAHGGRIELSSRLGEGSCFSVVLPRRS
ncbi:hybrid sensor histidine kinase/response regulator [Ectopseudomonas mendocina]|jgi:signal transduction histidine kinase|uniref:histidine kinase n=1 Tax=Ectopseudomonas mendocina TaxID=300 RepID=A0A379IMI4_ECTME|nr:hybrid sensor histidine kinase/response regulator [Pseudomonas mendocina]MBL0950126.1 hybrid sensor histidine kinase/response regulator [Pseudomonas sp.]AEB56216.1 response regulator receiver sensor signal transduction histidine kinase [Pseudomonas mendocina NK-01]MDF2076506.1 hybrid sensor histidine kinase/response regulator [Pseudomonas mendocina]QTN48081.1 hybrid sensor histidine kinase/response regulator [Pseudomonas mendocina]SUD37487.1 response regulator receiver sensor signal transdu